MRQVGATLHRGARASHHRGLSCCGAQAPDAQAQQLWLTGLVAPRHVGSSQTRARTRVPCIGRQILNHCATREAQYSILKQQDTQGYQSTTFRSVGLLLNTLFPHCLHGFAGSMLVCLHLISLNEALCVMKENSYKIQNELGDLN